MAACSNVLSQGVWVQISIYHSISGAKIVLIKNQPTNFTIIQPTFPSVKMGKIIMEKMYFKTITSQQTNKSLARYCPSAWVPSRSHANVCYLCPQWISQYFRWSLFLFSFYCQSFVSIQWVQSNSFWNLCPNSTSATVYVLKPHPASWYQEHPGKGMCLSKTLLFFCLQSFRFSRYTKHQVACCLLQRTLHSYPSSKATAPSHSAVFSCSASHFIAWRQELL